MKPTPTLPEVQPLDVPVVPIPQDPFVPRKRLQRLVNVFPGGQFFRYLMVGGFNTLFGYCTFILALALLSKSVPARFLYLSAPLASIVSTPFNITVAYFGYKLFVFRTRGNHLVEWLKCFAVYGSGMIPGLIALGALAGLLASDPVTPQRLAALAVAALAAVAAGCVSAAVCVERTPAAVPVIRRVTALRDKSWRLAFLRLRDPGARGRSRPRAPAAAPAAA